VIEAVVSKLTGFQDSEPVVALVGSAQRPGPVPVCRRLSWVHRPRKTGPARDWLSRKKRWVGAARSAARTRPCAPWRPGTAGYGRGRKRCTWGKTNSGRWARRCA